MQTDEKFHSPFFNSPFIFLIVGGLFELGSGLVYFLLFRASIAYRIESFVETGWLSYNALIFFDICFIIDIFLGIASFWLFFYLIRYRPAKPRRKNVQSLILILHLIIIPLSWSLDVLLDFLMT